MSGDAAPPRLAWHGLDCALPPGWEVTAYRLDPDAGEFRFHRRLEAMAQVSWSRPSGRPDPVKVMEERHRRWCEAAGLPATPLALAGAGPWTAGEAAGAPARAVAWQGGRGRLVEWVFSGASAEERARLLADARVDEGGGGWRWALFGVDLRPAGSWQLAALEARPGAVRLALEGEGDRRLVGRRFGLAAHLLAGRALDDWYVRLLRAGFARVEAVEAAPFRGHDGVRARFRIRGERGFDRAMGRRWHGLGRLWYDRDAKRLHAVESIARRSADLLEAEHAVP